MEFNEVINNENRKLNLAQKMYFYAMPRQYTILAKNIHMGVW